MLSFYITFPFWTCLRFPFGFGLSFWKSGIAFLEITLMLLICFLIFLFLEILFGSFHWYHLYKFFISMLIRFFLKIYINNEKVILFIFDNPIRQIELSEIFILLLGLCPYFPYSVLMIFLRFFSFSSSRYIHRKLIKYKTLW